jgi:DNA-binding transcriptional LysR family regulator
MRLRHVEVFHAIMTTGSVSRAAEVLRTSQPTASRVLAELERSVGFPLFARDRRRLVPTPEARDLFSEVQRNFTCLDRLVQMAERIAEFHQGNIRIAAAPSVSISVLPKAIQRFLERYPGVGTTLEVRTPASVLECVESRDFDFGITALVNIGERLRVRPLIRAEAVCILPLDHPLASRDVIEAGDLEDQPFISLGQNSLSRHKIDEVFEQAGVHRRMVAETQTGSVACALVSQGIGLTVLEFLTADVLARPPLTYRPFRPRVGIDFVLVTSKTRPMARVTDRFTQIFDETLAELDGTFVTSIQEV